MGAGEKGSVEGRSPSLETEDLKREKKGKKGKKAPRRDARDRVRETRQRRDSSLLEEKYLAKLEQFTSVVRRGFSMKKSMIAK